MPVGTQAILVCLAAASGVALIVARLTDASARPRLAPQVPRGAAGVVAGAMLGTLAAPLLGSYLVLPFTPAKGAVSAWSRPGMAVLADLAVGYAEAGRQMAGDAPTFWVARHMQGPLGAFALAAPAAYALMHLLPLSHDERWAVSSGAPPRGVGRTYPSRRDEREEAAWRGVGSGTPRGRGVGAC